MENPIVLYQSEDGSTTLTVRLQNDTVWLTQAQIADLFGTKRPAITKHLGTIFATHELDYNSARSKMEHTANDGKIYSTLFYNLDAIISIGYRVNSHNATHFASGRTKSLKITLSRVTRSMSSGCVNSRIN